MARGLSSLLWGVLLAFPIARVQGLKVDSRDDILKSASIVAGDLMALYDGNKSGGTPGRLPKDYNYWESSAFMSSFIDYWHLTNDTTYNDIVKEGLLFQAANNTFTPANLLPSYIGNNDQCFWGLTAMLAAEDTFPDSSQSQQQWLSIAQAVFDIQKARLDEGKECSGGLRWGMSPSHQGWGWKDSRSNGCLFDLAARLARYTGNTTYSDTAVKIWDWFTDVKLIDSNNWRVLQGADVRDNCASVSKLYYSVDGALLTHGAAFMYNHTNGAFEWRTRVQMLTASVLKDFFPSNLAFEPDCEVQELCNSDELAFKGVNIRWLAVVKQLAPFTSEAISKALEDTAKAMALGCQNGESSRRCQFYWLDLDPALIIPEKDPKTTGVGEEMNALSAFSNLLIKEAAPPIVAPPKKNPDPTSSSTPTASGSTDSTDSTKKGAGPFNTPSLSLILVGLLVSSALGSIL